MGTYTWICLLFISSAYILKWVIIVSISEARLRANKKYQLEKTDEIKLRVPKGNKERIQEHAKKQGESTNAFIYRAVNEAIERDSEKK